MDALTAIYARPKRFAQQIAEETPMNHMTVANAYPAQNHRFLYRLRDIAVRSVKKAGQILMKRYRQHHQVEASYPYDIKLRVDRLCEDAIRRIIQEAFPDHGFITEEGGCGKSPSGYTWIIDPLDGTVNYYHGIPHFSSCVACYYKEKHDNDLIDNECDDLSLLGIPLVGAVFSPVTEELFLGITGHGASCNGKEIQVRGEDDLREAVIGISYGSDENTMKRMERLGSKLVRGVRKVRIFGSTSLDMAHVASGRISGLVQGNVHNWDFAAARVILEESGGLFEAKKNGKNSWEIIACAAGIYESLKRLVKD